MKRIIFSIMLIVSNCYSADPLRTASPSRIEDEGDILSPEGDLLSPVDQDDYLNRFLPKSSEIRNVFNREKERIIPQWFILKSKKYEACEYINSVIKGQDSPPEPASQGMPGVFGDALEIVSLAKNNAQMKKNIRIALEDKSDQQKWDEYRLIQTACDLAQRRYNLRTEKERMARIAQNQYEKEHPRF